MSVFKQRLPFNARLYDDTEFEKTQIKHYFRCVL